MSLSRARAVELVLVLALFVGGGAVRQAVRAGWVFAGSDSYGYLKLADELRTHGRYALGPEPAPLHWARPPLFPMYLALVKGDARAEMSGGDGWGRITLANAWVDLGVSCGGAWLLARALGGPVAGLMALALTLFNPFTTVAVGAALTETLATALATAAVAVLVLLGMGRKPRLGFALAGALVGLSALTRPDGLLLALAFVPALLRGLRSGSGSLRRSLSLGVYALAGFALVFAPWPLRNWVRFDAPHPLGGRIDRYTQPVEHYHGSWAWLRSWAPDWRPMTRTTTCLYQRGCVVSVQDLAAEGAFRGPEGARERAEVAPLLPRVAREGHTEALSRAFGALATQRRRRHPVEVEVWLPLRRAWAMWVTSYHEYLQHPRWGSLTARSEPVLRAWSTSLTLGTLLVGALLLWDRRRRWAIGVILAAVLGRTAVLAFTFYSMPRYAFEVMPLAHVVIGAGVGALLARRAGRGERSVDRA